MSGDLDRAATALAALTVSGDTAALRGAELAAAAAARDSVLSSARHLLAGLTPRANRREHLRDPLAQTEHQPVLVLRLLLARQPLIRADAAGLSDALAHPAATPAVAGWQTAARHLFLTEHAWAGVNPDAVPAETAWGVTATVAGTALVLQRLDTQLGAAYRGDGHPHVADRLAAAADSGIGVAAREVLATAGTGPLDTTWTPPPPRAPGRIHPVLRPADLGPGADRYRDLVARAVTLSPTAVYELAQGQRVFLDRAARLLQVTDPTGAAALRNHTRELAAVPGVRNVATILASDPRPGAQLSQLVHQINRLDSGQLADPVVRESVRAAATAVAAASPALAATARSQQKLGLWVVPDEKSHTPRWRRIDTLDPAWTVDILSASRPSAEGVTTALTPRTAAGAPAASSGHAVEVLTAATNRQEPRSRTPNHSVRDVLAPVAAFGTRVRAPSVATPWADNAANVALHGHSPTGGVNTEHGATAAPGRAAAAGPVRAPTR